MVMYHRLTQEERYQIKALLDNGISIRAISIQLCRSPSTISRELKRNSSGSYSPKKALSMAQLRRKNIGPPRKIDEHLKSKITPHLEKQWSPEQISGWLKKSGIKVSHESIYQFVFKDFKDGGELYKNLRRRRRFRRSWQSSKNFKEGSKRKNRKWIDDRPKIVDERKRVGDFERDTVLGKHKGPVLLTIVDRTSRLTKIRKVEKINSDLTHKATIFLLKELNVITITNDNGPEFALHGLTEKVMNVEIYFNHPYSSWQRGTNENTNGLIRQYYPKGTDFSKIEHEEIQKVEDLLNSRPRKCLGYRTPNEVHMELNRSVALRD